MRPSEVIDIMIVRINIWYICDFSLAEMILINSNKGFVIIKGIFAQILFMWLLALTNSTNQGLPK